MSVLGPLAPHRDFPALRGQPGHPAPAYLDSACMSLTPQVVLDAQEEYYRDYPGCAGRSVHRWAEEVQHRYERARETFARFFDAPSARHLVNIRNSTEGLNAVALGLPWKKGSRVLLTDQEHNSNLVVWQRLQRTRGIRLEVLPLPADRPFDEEAYQRALERRPALVSFFHASNLDGRTLPARALVEAAHDKGARVLLDGSQAAAHQPVSLRSMAPDFYVLSFHKMLGPTGTGLLYVGPGDLETFPPWFVGGETVEETDYGSHTLRPPPHRFEAGLQNYAGVLGAEAAARYLSRHRFEELPAHLEALQRHLEREVEDIEGLTRLGPPRARDRGAVFPFVLSGLAPEDVALFLDQGHDVFVRSGMNCVHSWYRARGLPGNVRASFHVYTGREEVDRLARGLRELRHRVPPRPAGTRAA
jgi:cysteine desulfurase/selenocysteine lyase